MSNFKHSNSQLDIQHLEKPACVSDRNREMWKKDLSTIPFWRHEDPTQGVWITQITPSMSYISLLLVSEAGNEQLNNLIQVSSKHIYFPYPNWLSILLLENFHEN